MTTKFDKTLLQLRDSDVQAFGFSAESQGFKAWSLDPVAAASNTNIGIGGRLYVTRLHIINKSISITNIVIYIGVAGSGLTSGQCFAALYSADTGSLLGVTSDQSTAWQSVGEKSMAISGGPINVNQGYVYVALWYNGVTPPQLKCGVNSAVINVGMSSNFRFAYADSGITTTAPDPLSSSLTATDKAFFVGLN